MKKNMDLRLKAGRDAKEYVTKANYFALAVKASPRTLFLICDKEQLLKNMRNKKARNCFRNSGGWGWKGLMITHVKDYGFEFMTSFSVNHPWNEFEVGANNTMSEAQEKAVLNAVNEICFLGKVWKYTAQDSGKGYIPDLTSDDGKITIEVKGFNGRLFQ